MTTSTEPSEAVMPGPCSICGLSNYPLSAGGPTICPSCDCGDFGITKIKRQRKEIEQLQAERDARRIVIAQLTAERDNAWAEHDPYIESNVKLVAEGLAQQVGANTAEIAKLKAMIAHAAGFLAGLAARIEGWQRWDSGEGDTTSFAQAARDCREMATSLKRNMT